MDKQELKYGIQECSKCQYKLRCEECVYNKKDMQKFASEVRKETTEKFAEMSEIKSVYFNLDGTLYKAVLIEDINEICKEFTEVV